MSIKLRETKVCWKFIFNFFFFLIYIYFLKINPLSFLSFFNTQLYIILNVINQHEDYENIVNQLVWHQGNENNCNNFYFYHLVNQN